MEENVSGCFFLNTVYLMVKVLSTSLSHFDAITDIVGYTDQIPQAGFWSLVPLICGH